MRCRNLRATETCNLCEDQYFCAVKIAEKDKNLDFRFNGTFQRYFLLTFLRNLFFYSLHIRKSTYLEMHYYMAKNDYRSTNTLLQNSNRKPDNIKYEFNIPHNVFKILIK